MRACPPASCFTRPHASDGPQNLSELFGSAHSAQHFSQTRYSFYIVSVAAQEFHAVVKAIAVAHDCSHANGISKRRRKFHVNALGDLKFHAGKYQHAAFADVAPTTVNDGRLAWRGGNCANGHVEFVAGPASRPCEGGNLAVGEIDGHPDHCMAQGGC